MSSKKGPKYIYAQENKLYYDYYDFTVYWENKNRKKKMTTKQSEEIIFLSPTLYEKVNKHYNGSSILIGCLHRTNIRFSLFIGLFQRTKIHF